MTEEKQNHPPEVYAIWAEARPDSPMAGLSGFLPDNSGRLPFSGRGQVVYIASPLSGDVEQNLQFARQACRYAIAQDAAPIAPHLLYTQMLDDGKAEERLLGTSMGNRMLERCDELWLCGDRISPGMAEFESRRRCEMRIFDEDGQVCLYGPDGCAGKTSPARSAAGPQNTRTSGSYWRRSLELKAIPFMSLDLTSGAGDLLGESYWEMISPWRGVSSILNYVKLRIIELMCRLGL